MFRILSSSALARAYRCESAGPTRRPRRSGYTEIVTCHGICNYATNNAAGTSAVMITHWHGTGSRGAYRKHWHATKVQYLTRWAAIMLFLDAVGAHVIFVEFLNGLIGYNSAIQSQRN
jgi:hypothetical protein